MKKFFLLIAIVLLTSFTLMACNDEEVPVNNAPTLAGVQTAVAINLGESFNALTGVTANDSEDGVLTSSIVLSSSPTLTFAEGVATPTAVGTYTITYTVTDSADEVATATLTLTVNEVVVEAEPLYDNIFVYNINYGGTIYVNYLHFYRNGIFYYSKYNNGQFTAGFYEVSEEGSYTITNDQSEEITVPYLITFTDLDGNDYATSGWDGDTTVYAFSKQDLHNFVADPEFEHSNDDETGVIVEQFFVDGDEYSELLINHNGTFTDTVGLLLEGTWTVDGLVYTLTPTEGDPYTLTVSEDGKTATYVNGSTTQALVAPVDAVPLYTFNGSNTDSMGEVLVVLYLMDDQTALFAFNYYGGTETTVEGEWVLDDTTFTITVDSVDYTVAPDSNGTYSFDYNYKDDDNITIIYESNPGPALLFSWTGTGMTLDFYEDGTYIFEYATYGVVEEGTFSFASWTLTITQSNDNVITAAMDGTTHAFSLNYVAVASAQLTTTFTVEAAVWGAAFGSSGSYTPVLPEPALLFSWTGTSMTLDFYDDGTYVFEYATYGVVEEGTFSFTSWTLTITQSNDNVITAAMDGTTHAFSLNYVAVASAQLTTTFTVEAAVWGAAFGSSGSYTPGQ